MSVGQQKLFIQARGKQLFQKERDGRADCILWPGYSLRHPQTPILEPDPTGSHCVGLRIKALLAN